MNFNKKFVFIDEKKLSSAYVKFLKDKHNKTDDKTKH